MVYKSVDQGKCGPFVFYHNNRKFRVTARKTEVFSPEAVKCMGNFAPIPLLIYYKFSDFLRKSIENISRFPKFALRCFTC